MRASIAGFSHMHPWEKEAVDKMQFERGRAVYCSTVFDDLSLIVGCREDELYWIATVVSRHGEDGPFAGATAGGSTMYDALVKLELSGIDSHTLKRLGLSSPTYITSMVVGAIRKMRREIWDGMIHNR